MREIGYSKLERDWRSRGEFRGLPRSLNRFILAWMGRKGGRERCDERRDVDTKADGRMEGAAGHVDQVHART